jgi:uncharacterized protein YdhG (YjbR/CyaY superfamily)
MKHHKLVDDYINAFTGETRHRLTVMREIVEQIVPFAEEDFAYKMPAYKVDGRPLVYFAGYDHHVGFYATPNGHEAFKEEFASYNQGKGSVQFPHDKPLPAKLIERVVQFRVDAIKGN